MTARFRRLGQDGAVVKTGKRAAALEQLLFRAGFGSASAIERPPRIGDLDPSLRTAMGDLLQELGGDPRDGERLRPGAWDLVLDGRIVVELDEELHFIPLPLRHPSGRMDGRPPVEGRLPQLVCWTRARLPRCRAVGQAVDEPFVRAPVRGGKCTRRLRQRRRPHGGSSERSTTPSDAAALSGWGISLIRLSTHDVVGRAPLDDVLHGKSVGDLYAPRELVAERTIVG